MGGWRAALRAGIRTCATHFRFAFQILERMDLEGYYLYTGNAKVRYKCREDSFSEGLKKIFLSSIIDLYFKRMQNILRAILHINIILSISFVPTYLLGTSGAYIYKFFQILCILRF